MEPAGLLAPLLTSYADDEDDASCRFRTDDPPSHSPDGPSLIPAAVFTGIPLHPTALSYDEDDFSGSSTCDASYEGSEECTEFHPTLAKIRNPAFGIGFLTGCFLQLSSLGGNFMFRTLVESGSLATTQSSYLFAGLGWTSCLGVAVLWMARCMLSTMMRFTTNLDKSSLDIFLANTEVIMTVGALAGSCLSWTVTDVVLGVPMHLCLTLASLVIGLAAYKAIFYLMKFASMSQGQEVLEMDPLDTTCTITSVPTPSRPSAQSTIRRIHVYGVMIGFLIGLFIQYSSMAANFVLAEFLDKGTLSLSQPKLVAYSMVWSMLTSIIGVLILYSVRNLIMTGSRTNITDANGEVVGSEVSLDDLHNIYSSLATMESCFAIGALGGVNIAWSTTEGVLGLSLGVEQHVILVVVGAFFVGMWLYQNYRVRSEEKNIYSRDTAADEQKILVV